MQPWNPDSGISYKDWEKGYNRITYGDERGFEYGDRGKNYQNPGSLDKRIEDLFSRLPTSTGWPEGGTTLSPDNEGTYKRTPDPDEDRMIIEEQWGNNIPGPAITEPTIPGLGPGYGGTPPMQAPRPEGLQRVATGIADWITGNKWDLDQRGGSGIPRGRGQYDPRVVATTMMGRHPDGTPITFDNPRITQGPATPPMQTPPADVPTPPLEKTLEQRVWERGQMPKRTPDAQGRLYPDKNDPGFLDPRVQGDGRMTMQYIPELDDPNWTPWKNYGPGWSREQDWNKGGEGVQYRM